MTRMLALALVFATAIPAPAAPASGPEGGLLLLGVEGSRTPLAVGVPREVASADRIPTAKALDLLIEELESLFANDATIIDLIARAEDRALLARMYKDKTGMELADALKREMSGHDLRVALAMLSAKKSILTTDLARKQFRDAVDAFQKSGGKLKDGSWFTETWDLGLFLSDHLDVADKGLPERFVTGTEWALKEKVRAESERLGRKLTPGELFGLSLALNGGDKFKAVLAAHTMLRAQARGKSTALQSQVPEGRRAGDTFGAKEDSGFIDSYLQPISGGGDEAGNWYHFFGVAAMGMVAGESGAWAAVMAEEHGVSGDAKNDPIETYIDLLGGDVGSGLS